MSSWIETYTGVKFDPDNPSAGDVNIYDIAQGLALTCRYNGQISRHLSVAEHSVHMSNVSKYPFRALMHDAHEAYLGDIPYPFKGLIPGFDEFELRLQRHVLNACGIQLPLPDEIHELDRRIVLDEAMALKATDGREWGIEGEPLGINVEGWSWREARYMFLMRFATLTGTDVNLHDNGLARTWDNAPLHA